MIFLLTCITLTGNYTPEQLGFQLTAAINSFVTSLPGNKKLIVFLQAPYFVQPASTVPSNLISSMYGINLCNTTIMPIPGLDYNVVLNSAPAAQGMDSKQVTYHPGPY